MNSIVRKATCRRWAEVVIYRGEARWVEVASDPLVDFDKQIEQILEQIDQMLVAIGSSKDQLLEVLIFVTDLKNVPRLNELWDAWVDPQHPPIRACVEVGIQGGYLAEFIIRAVGESLTPE